MSFAEHTIESAPPGARRFLTATRDHLGYLPAGMARMAASPQLIDGFLKLTAIFENTALEPVAREVLVMTVATRNRCHICVAMHTARLTALGADPGLIEALRDADRAEPLPDERLDAVRVFTLRVLDTAGDVGDRALRDFLAAGYTTQNALEVVLGIGTYTMSTLANRLTGAPVDDQLAAYAWALSRSRAWPGGDTCPRAWPWSFGTRSASCGCIGSRPTSSRPTRPRCAWSAGWGSARRATPPPCCSSTAPGGTTSGGPSPGR